MPYITRLSVKFTILEMADNPIVLKIVTRIEYFDLIVKW